MGIIRYFFLAIAVILLGALGGIAGERVIFPKLASMPQFSFLGQFTEEGTTIINQTEQVIIDRSDALPRALEKITPTVVRITRDGEETSGLILTQDGIVAVDAAFATRPGEIIVERGGERLSAKLLKVESESGAALLRVSVRNLPVSDFDEDVSLAESLVGVLVRKGSDSAVSQEVFLAYVQRKEDDSFVPSLELLPEHRGMTFATFEGKAAGLVVGPLRAGGPMRVVSAKTLRELLSQLP